MQYKFLNLFLDKKDILSQNNEMIDSVLIENNVSQLENIYDFYGNERPILYVNGFLGTGKVQIINYSTNFLSEETIVLNVEPGSYKYETFLLAHNLYLASFFSLVVKLSH